MTDILKKPVHSVLIPITHIERLQNAGKLPKNAVSIDTEHAELPTEKQEKPARVQIPKIETVKAPKQQKLRTRLKVLHQALPEFPEEVKPPCNTCKASPCCKAFLVELTQEEYDSGLYDQYAVKLPKESKEQLRYNFTMFLSTVTVASALQEDRDSYYLEGKIGEDCPFLKNNRCSIYEDRPIVCRLYTCVGDPRITEEMRQGKQPVIGENNGK